MYLFAGEEAWYHEEGLRLLEGSVLEPGAGGVNRQALHGPDASLVELLDLAATYPMGPGRRLLIVRQASGLRADGVEQLKAYLASPNPRTCLVFSDLGFDERRAAYKALAAGAVRVDCSPVEGEAAVATWVRERLQGRGYGIAPELAEAIAVGLGGAGLQRLDAELDKLVSAVGPPRPVAATDLAILADVPRVGDAFEAARLALRGDRGGALRSLRGLFASGQDAHMMLGAMAWSVRAALKTRAATDRRAAARDLWTLYALSPSRAEEFRDLARRVPPELLRRALRLCLRADRELKGGGAKDPANALERLVHGLARATGPRP